MHNLQVAQVQVCNNSSYKYGWWTCQQHPLCTPMCCSGIWNDPGKCGQFTGALHCIHVANLQNRLFYCEICEKCNLLSVNERLMWCDNHANSLLLLTAVTRLIWYLLKPVRKGWNDLSRYVSQLCGQPLLAMSTKCHHVLCLATHLLICKV